MYFATVFTLGAAVVSTSASFVARQSLPNCAAPCIANPNIGTCVTVEDTHCLCTNQTFLNTTTACIEKACTGSDLQNAISYSEALCAAVGVTLTSSGTATPSAAPSASSATTSTSTSSASTATANTSTSSASTATTSASTSSASTAATATPSKAAAATHGTNAFVGLAALGLVALAL